MGVIEIEMVQIRIGNFLLNFVSVPTKNNKRQPRLLSWTRDGQAYDPAIDLNDIPKPLLRDAYAKVAVIFNKF
jgi:hypothetical protein